MGITYFASGMLSMLALMFIGVIVWGLFRVSKIERQINVIKQNDRFEFDNVQRQFENVYRSIGEIRNDYSSDMNNMWKDVTTKFDECYRYTDKRIDKSCTKHSHQLPPERSTPTFPLT